LNWKNLTKLREKGKKRHQGGTTARLTEDLSETRAPGKGGSLVIKKEERRFEVEEKEKGWFAERPSSQKVDRRKPVKRGPKERTRRSFAGE